MNKQINSIWETEDTNPDYWISDFKETKKSETSRDKYVSRFFDIIKSYEKDPRMEVRYPNLENMFTAYFNSGPGEFGEHKMNLKEEPRGTKEVIKKLKQEGKWLVHDGIFEGPDYNKWQDIVENMYKNSEKKGYIQRWGTDNGFTKGDKNREGFHMKLYICNDGSQTETFFKNFVDFIEHNNVSLASKRYGGNRTLNGQKLIMYVLPSDFHKVADFLSKNRDKIHPVEMNLPWGVQLFPGVSVFPEEKNGGTPSLRLDQATDLENIDEVLSKSKTEKDSDVIWNYMHRLVTDEKLKKKEIRDYPWEGAYGN